MGTSARCTAIPNAIGKDTRLIVCDWIARIELGAGDLNLSFFL